MEHVTSVHDCTGNRAGEWYRHKQSPLDCTSTGTHIFAKVVCSYDKIIFGSIWRSSLFSLICLFSVKTVQNSENSQYPNASKCFQIAKTVQHSENSFLVSGTLSYCTVADCFPFLPRPIRKRPQRRSSQE
jgi:hypothetical protein